MTPTTGAIFSISERICELMITVMPRSRLRPMIISRTSTTASASSPFVGSSSNRSSGCEINAIAMPSRCFIPSE